MAKHASSINPNSDLRDSQPLTRPLDGHAAIVTGAGWGIGRAVAIRLALEGARVVGIARTRSQLEETVACIKANAQGSGADAVAIAFDPCDIDRIPSLVQEIHQRLGGNMVDILVNSAGIARIDALECQPDMKIWQQVLTTNLNAPVALTTALLPFMLSAGRGTIISMGSLCAVVDVPYLSAYAASKTALLRFHHDLQSEVGVRGSGITTCSRGT
ncbi:hypothetical protein MAPG_04196 [Magnaporthiopsis poae ATCC 64411]|uniref:Uncharacterized protein n=1 Tax=Magnaporthiopsis poae (strain ATCC 64411 / 73-15) TaxID=644358 RepID=A0A0C4DW27_MAGP6|nr:hypothetical protein MAPG_04196 [Magnaporthiopsis poae ATCC 64411]